MLKASAFLVTSFVVAGLAVNPVPAAAQGGAAQPARPTAGAAPAPRAATTVSSWKDPDYRLGPGDKLRIEVFEQPQLSQSVQIRPDGKITLPFVDDVAAAGQTSGQLRDSLTASLKEFVRNPVVTVIVQEATSAKVCLIGEIRNPGCLVMNGPMTALEAISLGGDLTEFARRNDIHILRRNGTKLDRIPFNYRAALSGEIGPVYLQPGDQIVVR